MENKVYSYKLANDLTVIMKEIHSAPLVSTWIWYKVGSRNEIAGKTGLSHWVEHMQFKGTDKYPSHILDKAISRLGGYWNAFTFMDWTTYFETMPFEAYEISLDLEADRMINSRFDLEEVELERTVVISEREGSENDPLFRLGEAVQNEAIQFHPYRYEVGGTIEDIHSITRKDLYQHYRTYYQPSNAILCIAGDFDHEKMLLKVSEKFEPIPTNQVDRLILEPEPLRNHGKEIEVRGPGKTTYLQLSYPAPKADSDDFFVFTVLDSLLTGPSSLNMFGSGSVSNKTSILYEALVEEEYTVSISGGLQATIDPFLYNLHFTIHPDRKIQDVLKIIDQRINTLLETLVDSEQILRAVKQARALFTYGSENITNQGFWLGYANIFANYDWFVHYIDRLEIVTPNDVLRIAQKYLDPYHRVTGVFIPKKRSG